jgi:cytoskeleton protein RodZ
MPIEQASTEQQALVNETGTAGSLLAEARKARGLDEKQVADQLHITVHYVKAIEADLYEKLPGAIFARGYIKSYASFLGLDVEDILSRYQAVAGQQQSSPTRIEAPARSKPRRQRNLQWALASVGVFSAVIIAAWLLNGDSGSSNEVAVAGSQSSGSASSQTEVPATEVPATMATSSAGQPASATDSPTAEETGSQQALLTTQSDTVQAPPVGTANPEQDETAASPAGSVPVADAEPEPVLAATDSSPASSSEDVDASAVADSETLAASQSGETAVDSEVIADTPPITASSAADDASAAGQTEASADSIADDSEEPAGNAAAAARPEELAVINVMQGSNGERIIAVDANGEDVLRISFSGESWVEVNDSQARMVYRDLRQAGDVLEITGHAPFNILLGDAPLASLRFNGDEIDVSDDIRIDNSARLTVGL